VKNIGAASKNTVARTAITDIALSGDTGNGCPGCSLGWECRVGSAHDSDYE